MTSRWVFNGLAPHCTVSVMTTTRNLLQTKNKLLTGPSERGVTMTNMRQTLTGGAPSVVCQCGKFYKNQRGQQIHQTKSGSQICEKHQQQASGLLAPVFMRSESRPAKDHYPFQSHGLHQHMQVVKSWQQIQSRKDSSQLRLKTSPPLPPPEDYLPRKERQWLGIVW